MSATTTAVPRLTLAALTQHLSSQKSLKDSLTGADRRRAVLLRSAPEWSGPAEHAWDGDRCARVAAAPSPLAVHELVIDHLARTDGARVLVVLTDREQDELDPAVLARVHKQRVEDVDGWDVVREVFGAEAVDPRLKDEVWASESLLDALPPGGWPRLPGGTLARRHALAELALRRLRLGRYGDNGDQATDGSGGLDTPTLLRWATVPGNTELLLALRGPERSGLEAFLGEPEQAGPAGRVLVALVEAGHGQDALAYGLVCSALWNDRYDPDAAAYRARGRAERWLGEEPPAQGEALDVLLTVFGRSCFDYVSTLFTVGRQGGDGARAALRITAPALDRAARLADQFGAGTAAAHSPLLREGLDTRFATAGRVLADGLPEEAAAALARLEAHGLAQDRDTRVRVERVRMGYRLVRWLSTDPATETETVASGVNRQISDTGWVDRALDHIEAGGDPEPELRAAYARLGARVRDRLHEIDRSFARTLATWTAAGTGPGSMLTVETFLDRVVRPVVADKAGYRVLLLVLDGMSAAIAAELAEELRLRWAEYDPLPGTADSPPRRRGMAAALPTLTAVSRTSLFAGKLMKGSQADERRLFPQHRFWRGAPAAAFHKDALRIEQTGDPFDAALTEALTDGRTHVAVVLNTIDDRLAKEQKLGNGAWELNDVGKLPELLTVAAEQGMAVILTSDHGHVVDRHGSAVAADAVGSARHREPGGFLQDNEIALSGPRVVWPEPGAEIVALWDADSRYTAQKAGYHGGASPAEFTIPVLAFLPFGAEPPKGWRELGDQQPRWWGTDEPTEPSRPAGAVAPSPVRKPKPARRRDEQYRDQGALFEVAPTDSPEHTAPARDEAAAQDGPVAKLMESTLFQVQVDLLARRPNPAALDRIRRAVEILLDAGTLSTTALAQRVGHPQGRADGFAAVLRQLLNYDGVQVLETLSDGRTLRLNPALLREQFELE